MVRLIIHFVTLFSLVRLLSRFKDTLVSYEVNKPDGQLVRLTRFLNENMGAYRGGGAANRMDATESASHFQRNRTLLSKHCCIGIQF